MSDNPEIRYLGDLQRLTISPNDKFVLTVDHLITSTMRDRIQDVWETFTGPDIKLLILDKGMKLGAIGMRVEPEPTVTNEDRARAIFNR